jgi:hypothetical protein
MLRQLYQGPEKGRVFCSLLSQKTGEFLLLTVMNFLFLQAEF